MDTRCQLGKVNIDLQMSKKAVYVAGRGYLHFATVLSFSTQKDLATLINKNLWSEKIIGVEYRKLDFTDNYKNTEIALLLKNQMW